MDYKEFAEICSERAELYKKQGDVWAQLHEERCATVITELLARAEAAENIASDLCDDFTDFVTGGVPNAAPYCANRHSECVNTYGWCNGDDKVCRGFMPKAAVQKEE